MHPINTVLISLGRSLGRRVAPDRPGPTLRPRCGPLTPSVARQSLAASEPGFEAGFR
jgi:hypothetical protein